MKDKKTEFFESLQNSKSNVDLLRRWRVFVNQEKDEKRSNEKEIIPGEQQKPKL